MPPPRRDADAGRNFIADDDRTQKIPAIALGRLRRPERPELLHSIMGARLSLTLASCLLALRIN
jgi:hypothetical protein